MPQMKAPFYGHTRQYESIQKELDDAIRDVILSGQYVTGPTLKRFEGELARYCGQKHAVGVNSGTDALWLTFMALGLKEGDEVITTANTFFATAEAIWIAGGKVVLVDCDPATRNMDPAKIEAAITSRTVGIVPVHLYGLCADMKVISDIARKRKLWVVEDNAQAIDGHGPGWKQGELSDAVCTSFIIQKNLGTLGDGGAVVTDRDDIDAVVRKLRNHGSTVRSVHSFGFNSRLDDIHAGILSVKLKHITRWTDRRREIAARYTKGLQGTSFRLPVEPAGYRHVFHLYVIEHPQREELEKFLLEAGVDVKLHYPIAIHKQEGYPWGKPADLRPNVPNCERNAAECVSLPMFPELTDGEVDYTIEQCLEWDRQRRG
ncbi:MAG TPA: DegT/DnrJ/EryC1/StrS family aminotransferase [Vicinamibacteria bacterium]|nr:DegT/DnrJ/EryC1/StrS family aminotransferase [Vicinamibacteria bacterium]